MIRALRTLVGGAALCALASCASGPLQFAACRFEADEPRSVKALQSIASDRGLGYKIQEYTNNFDTPMTFGAILVLCVMGLLLYGAVEIVERFAIPWHVSRRAADGGAPAT